MICTIIQCPFSLSQIMALVVIALGASVSIFFQIFVRENPAINPPRRRWYKWFMKPQFYVVSCHRHCITTGGLQYMTPDLSTLSVRLVVSALISRSQGGGLISHGLPSSIVTDLPSHTIGGIISLWKG